MQSGHFTFGEELLRGVTPGLVKTPNQSYRLIVSCQCCRSSLASDLRGFVSRGGVVLLSASLSTDLPAGSACVAPLALLDTMLGGGGDVVGTGCSCVEGLVPGEGVVPVDYTAVAKASRWRTWIGAERNVGD